MLLSYVIGLLDIFLEVILLGCMVGRFSVELRYVGKAGSAGWDISPLPLGRGATDCPGKGARDGSS